MQTVLRVERPQVPQPNRPLSEGELHKLVLAYFNNHREAMDTLEGIEDFWIKAKLRRVLSRVERENLFLAVQGLCVNGVLEQIGDERPYRYRLRDGESPLSEAAAVVSRATADEPRAPRVPGGPAS